MDATAPTLTLATMVAAMATCSLAWRLHIRRVHAAFNWWAAALALNTAALCLMTLASARSVFAIGAPLLLLYWPVLVTAGLRRFDARLALQGNVKLDLLIGAAVVVAAAAAALQTPHRPWIVWALQAAVTAYAAAICWQAGSAWRSVPTQALALAWSGMAALPLAAIVSSRAAAFAAFSQVVLITIAAIVIALAAPWLSSQRTERRLRIALRRLQVLANTDMLTQVSNRRHFEELACRFLQSEGAEQTALVLIDIDHFKKINDKLGHAAGDRALRLVSRSARELLRDQDLAGRHGGDEFALLLAQTTLEEAMRVAQRLVSHIQARSQRQALPRLSLSFGIVQPRRGEAIADALRRADLALYEAKRLGRSRAVSAAGDEQQPEFHSSERLGLTSF